MRGFFSISDDGELKWYLGVKFDRQADGSVKATQEAYLDRCLKRYGLQDAAPAPTPMDARFAITENDIDENAPAELIKEYQSLIGSLIYHSVWTAPEI
eukprot:3939503-Rhodomonas_salina.2